MRKAVCIIFFFHWITSGQTQVIVVVTEDSDAVLPCSLRTKENIQTKIFDWKKGRQNVFLYNGGQYYGRGLSGQDKQFEGRVSHFNEDLKNGNASIKIRNTKVADSGNYTCILPRLQPRQEFIIELVVAASPEPYTKILHQTGDRALLQCEVKGASPEPKVEWRDSSGNILHAEETQRSFTGGKYDIIIQANVTKTDTYSCELKQEEIHHVVTSQTFVYISVNNGWHEGLAVGLAVGVMFLAAVEALSLRCIPSLRNKVFDFLRRLQPRPEEDVQMDPETPLDNDDPGFGSRLPLKSSNGSTH